MNTSTSPKPYYLGCDASKGYCDFVIITASKKVVEKPFQLDDTSVGHESLREILGSFFCRYPDGLLYSGVESTGGYETNWYQMLFKLSDVMNVKVSRLNPVGVNHNKKAALGRNSTDKISALAIAYYLIDHPGNIIYNPIDPFAPLRKEWKFIKMLCKQKIQLVNQLESTLYTTHPQMLEYWNHHLARWFLLVIAKYPSAKKLAGATVKGVSKIPYVTQSKAKALIQGARQSVGSEQDKVSEIRVKALAGQLLHMDKFIQQQTQLMIQHTPIAGVEILTSFNGIAEFSAVGLMLIIGDINRFASCEKWCSYIGVHPIYVKSGDQLGEIHMSKKGSKEARWILFNVAKSAIVHDEMIGKLYESYLQKGKEKMAAIGIMMHKIARIIYGMLKHKQKYDPAIDEKNRQNQNHKERDDGKVDKNRRYQKPDQKAPISKRQKKKRQLEYQDTPQYPTSIIREKFT